MSKFLHLSDCRCGTHGKRVLKKDDDWYVNSPSHHNCFWVYMRHNTRPHTLYEIAEKLNLSISAITTIERKAFGKLKNKVKPLLTFQAKNNKNR